MSQRNALVPRGNCSSDWRCVWQRPQVWQQKASTGIRSDTSKKISNLSGICDMVLGQRFSKLVII
jgi:hypothetical protein